MTSPRGFGRVEPSVLVTGPVLEDGVSNHQPIQSAEFQQAHTILILLCRSKPTNGTPPGCSIIPHSGIKVHHDQQHVTPWNLLHTLLQRLVKRHRLLFIHGLVRRSIHSNERQKKQCGISSATVKSSLTLNLAVNQ